MKYLLMMIIALATIGTATATSQRADCCTGAKCCSGGHCCARQRQSSNRMPPPAKTGGGTPRS